MNNILVVDDEKSIIELLRYNLELSGYDVDESQHGDEALNLIRENNYLAVILDLKLPGKNGIDIARIVRSEGIETPIIMLTASSDEITKIIGLEIGADDYMTKPFSPRELIARIKAITRRSSFNDKAQKSEITDDIIKVGDIEINPERYEVIVRGENISITPKQFELLNYLIKNSGRVLSRTQLLDAIWDFDYYGGTRIVDVHISHLRNKIEVDPKRPKYIITQRGFGYRFEVNE